ncbi:MAG: hypothetical protein CL677_08015 [Bdellovibrionaceae bacterium]|nr:hypothetical protein [Pseudobdellovibrionaceae bacterium]|tara:strand:+ start:892 stop:1098 length:207 start_codon:yes stop_codon:yes gene_type:complete
MASFGMLSGAVASTETLRIKLVRLDTSASNVKVEKRLSMDLSSALFKAEDEMQVAHQALKEIYKVKSN